MSKRAQYVSTHQPTYYLTEPSQINPLIVLKYQTGFLLEATSCTNGKSIEPNIESIDTNIDFHNDQSKCRAPEQGPLN